MAGENEVDERQGLMPMASPPSHQVPQAYLVAPKSPGARRTSGPMGGYSPRRSLDAEQSQLHSAVSSNGEEGHFLDAPASPFDDPRSVPLPLSARSAGSSRSGPGPMQRAQAEGLAASSAASQQKRLSSGAPKGSRLSALMSALGGATDSNAGNSNKEATQLLSRRSSQQSIGEPASPFAGDQSYEAEGSSGGNHNTNNMNFLSYPPMASASASPRIKSGDIQAMDDHTLSPSLSPWSPNNGGDKNSRRASSGAYLPPRPGSTGTRTPGTTTPTRRHSGVGGRANANDGLPQSPDDLGLGVMMPSLVSHYLPEKVSKPHRVGSRRHRGTSAYADEDASSDRLAVPDENGGTGSGSNTPRSRWSAGAFRRKGNSSNPASPHADTFPHRSVSQGTGQLPDLPLSPVVDNGQHLTLTMPSDTAVLPSLASPSNSMPRPMTKFGGGRAAWGPDGAGNPELGAGEFEDDDGVELNDTGNNDRAQSGRSAHSSNERVSDEEALTGDAAELHRLAYGAADAITGNEGIRRRNAAGPGLARGQSHEKDGLVGFSDASLPSEEYERQHEDDNTRHLSSRAIFGGGLFSRIFAGFFLRGKKAQQGGQHRRLRWNKFKWTLFLMNIILTIYAVGGLIGTLLTWANVWESSDIIREANNLELRLATVAAGLCFVTAILGWAGVLLNNRAFLAVYNLMLWICFAFIVAPGYITYKKRTFNLEGKMNYLWSRNLSTDGRRTIQNSLSCCGYYNPFIEAAASSRCYARSTLPGCKGRFIRFERDALKNFYAVAFALVAPHLILIVIALLSSNHVTYRFGKGLTPAAYRLDEPTAKAIQLDFLAQLKSMYGPSVLHSLDSLHKRRASKAPSSSSHTYLLDPNGGSPNASADGHLEPPKKGALFKDRHDSFSTEGSSGGSPLRQSLGLHDLAQDGSALDTPDEKAVRRRN